MISLVYAISAIVLKILYLALPALSAYALVWSENRDLRRQVASAWISGTLLGSVILVAFTFAIGGSIAWQQVVLTIYLGISLMLLLKGVDFLLRAILIRWARRVHPGMGRLMLARVVRLGIFVCFALPWVMAALMVYRPRVIPAETPDSVMHVSYANVHFKAKDGTRIDGWWIPPDHASNTTVLLCHGLGSNKAGFFAMMDKLHAKGIGVLSIDFRAHGESGGQISTFGAKETFDVLGAVDWLKDRHPRQAQRVIGVGASMGAAALLQAAADDSRLDGVVALGAFDTLPHEVQAAAFNRLFPPIGWLVRAFGLQIASLHAGVNLNDVRPVDAIGRLWPRPVLVIHGTEDEIVPFALGRQLYNAASLPCESMWVQGATHNNVLENPQVIQRIIEFVRSAQPLPVV